MKRLRQLIGIGCSAFLVLMLLAFCHLFVWPGVFGDVVIQFVDLPGDKAMDRIGRLYWPEGIDSSTVKKASGKWVSSIDTGAYWAKVSLSPETAEEWQNIVHSKQAQTSSHDKDKQIEGVTRTTPGPPSLREAARQAPAWWKPPSIEFRSTERMRWYKDHDSGIGDATYTAYDQATGTLWMFVYSYQHDQLWNRGEVPEGERIP